MFLTPQFNPTHTHPTEIAAVRACVNWLQAVEGSEDKSGILDEGVNTAPLFRAT